MLSFLVILAVLNLGLGFALALWLAEPESAAAPSLAPPPARATVANQAPPAPEAAPKSLAETSGADAEAPAAPNPLESGAEALRADIPSAAEAAPAAECGNTTANGPAPEHCGAIHAAETVIEPVSIAPQAAAPLELPPAWLELLAGSSAVHSYVEASAEVLKLEVGAYRRQLTAVESEIRAALDATTLDQLHRWTSSLLAINAEWLTRQMEVAELLSAQRTDAAEWLRSSRELSELLDQQTAQIETTSANLSALSSSGAAPGWAARLLREIAKLIDLAHALRDRTHELLLTIASGDGRLDQLDRRFLVDADGMQNRAGIERVFQQWWRDDPSRSRTLSCVAIDVDRLGLCNESLGTLVGDALLTALGRVLSGLVRRGRGFDVVARVAGQRYLLFLGDTGPRGATSAAERIRQSVAATAFEFRQQPIPLTISCGVTEVWAQDTTASTLARLQAALAVAKQSQRNCTVLDEGSGPERVNPPVYDVGARTVQLAEAAAAASAAGPEPQ